MTTINKEEWLSRCAAEFQRRNPGMVADVAMTHANAAHGALGQVEGFAADPEGAADEEMAAWSWDE